MRSRDQKLVLRVAVLSSTRRHGGHGENAEKSKAELVEEAEGGELANLPCCAAAPSTVVFANGGSKSREGAADCATRVNTSYLAGRRICRQAKCLPYQLVRKSATYK